MTEMSDLEKKISETLDSVKHIQKATPPDFFYTRLKARMGKELLEQPQLRWLLKPAFVIPVLSFTIILNVLTFKKLKENKSIESDEQTFMEYYNLNTSYDLELH